MEQQHKETLRSCSSGLQRELEVDEDFLQHLQEDKILTAPQAEKIMVKATSYGRAWVLLQLLPKRGPQAFTKFCRALRETQQEHLCEMLMSKMNQLQGVSRDVSYTDSSCPLSVEEVVPAKRSRLQESMELSLDTDSPINTPVLPCDDNFYTSHAQESYDMTSTPHGLALVISNVTFDPNKAPELGPRKGGDVDEEVLRNLLVDLDYKVDVRNDLTAQGIRECVESFRSRADHSRMDSCVVCLLSHGVDGAVYGSDGTLLQLEWMFKAFDNVHCPQLQNKPKMFFIQACRGEEMDCGVEQVDGPDRTGSPSCEQRDAGVEGRSQACSGQMDSDKPRIKLPQRSDMICGFASLRGTAAMRNTKRGSWYIQDLNQMLRQHAKDMHLADILVQVNGRIKQREGFAPGTDHHRCKEMSEYTSSLCKNLYFFPKHR